ncbi:FAD-dependent oxidoreductase [Planococcus sp. CP5-4]|uniref:FAD-dependent oxidoreductase n=2 Tax=Planococcus TaxID=1372 RepID=UPI001C2C7AC5|nr:FAD-dependent oxidoreductase [Planococcus sp. CP5-4]MBV0908899.1 FAD-dependent oxidoreductase [Planococcus sp. CP5-4_UN]MBW6063948.1 FAD-dependent oxidoreductase [Planococcus sp. CP5-4]
MGVIQDIAPILKKKELTLVESYEERDEVYTFIFKKEEGLTWKAGQHGIFSITHKKIKKSTRPFSVASAPFENTIKVSTRISEAPSEFKKALLELEPGMKLNMRGPVGPLYIDHETPALLIAGGIGITPFRAILKEAEQQGRHQLQLLYIDSKESFLYKNELDEIAKDTSITVNYLNSREELYAGMDIFIKEHNDAGMYYLGGSKSMVDSVETYLKNHRVSKGNIKKDIFIGLK